MMQRKWMKRGAWLGGIAIAAAATFGSTQQTSAQNTAKVQWETSLTQAMQKSKASKKPILMDVYATWCGPCKMMDKNTYANASVVNESKKWIMLKVDGDENEQLAARYGVQGYPTTLFLKSDGKAVAGFAGYAGPAEMIKLMRAAAPKAR